MSSRHALPAKGQSSWEEKTVRLLRNHIWRSFKPQKLAHCE